MPKRDRFGLHLKIEHLCVEILEQAIVATLEQKENKKPILQSLRIKIEVAKRLIRTAHELNIIQRKTYFDLQMKLQEISKMTNGWIRYLS